MNEKHHDNEFNNKVRSMTNSELFHTIENLQMELMSLKDKARKYGMSVYGGQDNQNRNISKVKKEIARIKTEMRRRGITE